MDTLNVIALALGILQFLLLLLISLIGFIFKNSLSNTHNSINELKSQINIKIDNMGKSIDEIKSDRKEDRVYRKEKDDLFYNQLRNLQEKKADKEELDKLERRLDEFRKLD